MTEPTKLSEAVARAIEGQAKRWLGTIQTDRMAQAAIRAVLEGIMEPATASLAAGSFAASERVKEHVSYGTVDAAFRAMIRHIIERECG